MVPLWLVDFLLLLLWNEPHATATTGRRVGQKRVVTRVITRAHHTILRLSDGGQRWGLAGCFKERKEGSGANCYTLSCTTTTATTVQQQQQHGTMIRSRNG